MYEYAATLVRVVDGDTAILSVDCGFYVFAKVRCRLARINAPELTSKDPAVKTSAEASRDALTAVLSPAKVLYVTTGRPDDYGRWITEIELEKRGGLNVSDWMVTNGLAVAYRPKAKG